MADLVVALAGIRIPTAVSMISDLASGGAAGAITASGLGHSVGAAGISHIWQHAVRRQHLRRRRTQHPDPYIADRGRALADLCRETDQDPMDLKGDDLASAIGFRSAQSMRTSCLRKGTTSSHIQAHAYHLLLSEKS